MMKVEVMSVSFLHRKSKIDTISDFYIYPSADESCRPRSAKQNQLESSSGTSIELPWHHWIAAPFCPQPRSAFFLSPLQAFLL